MKSVSVLAFWGSAFERRMLRFSSLRPSGKVGLGLAATHSRPFDLIPQDRPMPDFYASVLRK